MTSTDTGAPAPMGWAARVLHRLIRGYQWLFAGRVSPCRFDPSCSTYALGAVERHGFVRGTWLAVRRLARCHPWGGHGWDPVPDRSSRTRAERRRPRPEQQVA
jgi:uncharacterized protein